MNLLVVGRLNEILVIIASIHYAMVIMVNEVFYVFIPYLCCDDVWRWYDKCAFLRYFHIKRY